MFVPNCWVKPLNKSARLLFSFVFGTNCKQRDTNFLSDCLAYETRMQFNDGGERGGWDGAVGRYPSTVIIGTSDQLT
jgi:hypothetical protein